MTTHSYRKLEELFPSIKDKTAWNAGDALRTPASLPALNRDEYDYMSGFPATQIDRSKIANEYRVGELITEEKAERRAADITKQFPAHMPPNVAWQIAGNMSNMQEASTLFMLIETAQFKRGPEMTKPRSNHPLIQVPPPRGVALRPVYMVHHPFNANMRPMDRFAEMSVLDDTHIERVPKHDDTDVLNQLEGICRGHSYAVSTQSDATLFISELQTKTDTRDRFLEAGGAQSSWDAHQASDVLNAFLTGQMKRQPAFGVSDPNIRQNPTFHAMALSELRLRALAEAEGASFPWTSKQFSQIYNQISAKDEERPSFGLIITPTGMTGAGRLAASIYTENSSFGNFMHTGSANKSPELYEGMTEFPPTTYALPLIQAVQKVMQKGGVTPDSDVGRMAAVVSAAGTVFAPKAMGLKLTP